MHISILCDLEPLILLYNLTSSDGYTIHSPQWITFGGEETSYNIFFTSTSNQEYKDNERKTKQEVNNGLHNEFFICSWFGCFRIPFECLEYNITFPSKSSKTYLFKSPQNSLLYGYYWVDFYRSIDCHMSSVNYSTMDSNVALTCQLNDSIHIITS